MQLQIEDLLPITEQELLSRRVGVRCMSQPLEHGWAAWAALPRTEGDWRHASAVED